MHMAKKKADISPFHLAGNVVEQEPANLLCTVSADGRYNVMTITWGLIGVLWSKPVFMIAVRPERYTYKFLEETGEFTVNVSVPELRDAVDFCGTKSGRDYDKFKECSLTPIPGKKVGAPVISEACIHYECRVIHKAEASPLTNHRLYIGEILAAYADEELIGGA
jgi:flavin reductase (DIM6/NTAB) family NADH-FMN oxidoreductase RutF